MKPKAGGFFFENTDKNVQTSAILIENKSKRTLSLLLYNTPILELLIGIQK